MSCFFERITGIFLPGKSWVSRWFKHHRSTMKEPGAPANQSRSSAVWSLKAWHPEAAKRAAKRLDVHPIFGSYLVHKCAGVQMYTGIYDIYIYGIYIIYIFKGKKQVCTCAIMLHPSSWFAAFGSLIQNWPRSEAIRTSHILGVGPLRASAFVSW
jgi:hypothetical protein